MGTKHPKFQRPNRAQKVRVKDSWRKPHGIDSKQRQKIKWAGAVVNKGYRGNAELRYLHPLGKMEAYVRNMGDLQLVQKGQVIRMQSGLSKRSKEAIRKKAAEMGLAALN